MCAAPGDPHLAVLVHVHKAADEAEVEPRRDRAACCADAVGAVALETEAPWAQRHGDEPLDLMRREG